METKVNILTASDLLVISSGLVPATPEKTSEQVSSGAGTSSTRNGDTFCSALAHRQKREHHVNTEQGNSSSHLFMAATDANDNFRSPPFYPEYPHVGTFTPGNTHFGNSSTRNGQEISSDHPSFYIPSNIVSGGVLKRSLNDLRSYIPLHS